MKKIIKENRDTKYLKLADEIVDIAKRKDRENVKPEEYPNLAKNIMSNKYLPELIEALEGEPKYRHSKQQKVENYNKMLLVIKKKERARKLKRVLITSFSVASASILFFISITTSHIEITEEIVPKSVLVQRPSLILGNGNTVDLKNTVSSSGYDIDTVNNVANYKGREHQLQKLDSSSVVTYNTIIVPKMYTYNVILEDGTKVKLNANSELRYPTRFLDDKREVILNGEGYFDVSKSEKPFIVKANNVNIEVYGTKFNVNMRSQGYVEAVLAQGSIGIYLDGKQDSEVILKPNQMTRFNVESGVAEIKEVDSNMQTAWISGFLCCETEPLTLLLEEISNWFNVKFKYNDHSIKNVVVIASININKPIDEILNLIEIISDVKFIKEGEYDYTIEKKN